MSRTFRWRRSSFARWDSALELFKSLESGWLDLTSVSATAYGDIVHMQGARADHAVRLRAMLQAEETACKHPAGWADAQYQEMTDG